MEVGGEMGEKNKPKKQKVDSKETVGPGPVSYSWRKKLKDREEMLKYLKTGERYWYSDDWFGSEKRKNPA
ncbi:hypothetical protein KAW55_02735 [bacterium]|nr:hypothetical protein [bacterium]MCK4325651.1 hypothetical protein [bacterium]